MPKKTKRRIEYEDWLKTLSNKELFDETIQASQPDDWDGSFSQEGLEQWEASLDELENRLRKIKFFDYDQDNTVSVSDAKGN